MTNKKQKSTQEIEEIIRIPEPSTGKLLKIVLDEDQIQNIKFVENTKDNNTFHVPGTSPGKILEVVVDKKELKRRGIKEFVIFTMNPDCLDD